MLRGFLRTEPEAASPESARTGDEPVSLRLAIVAALLLPLFLTVGLLTIAKEPRQSLPMGPVSASSPGATPSHARVPATRIGLNLFGVASYNRQQVFTNLIAQSHWFTSTGATWSKMDAGQLDERGWVKFLLPGQTAPRPLILPPAPFTAISVRCTFSGGGELSVGGIAHESGRGDRHIDFDLVSRGRADEEVAWIELKRTDPADPLRNIDCRERARPRSELFHPDFLAFLRGFSVIRFLDWQHINENQGGSWPARTQVTDSSQILKEGVAIEHLVALANQTGIDPWFLMPYNADAAYIENFARLVHDQLDSDRIVHVELGNEVWNNGFEAARQAREEGRALRLGADPMRAQMRRYAQKSREALRIWTRVFADRPEKLVRIVSSLNVYPDLARVVLDHEDTAQWVDALATAPYIYLDLAGRDAGDVEWIYSRLNAAVEETIGFAARNRDIAASYGKRFITYEGGQHLVTGDLELARRIQRDPRMGAVYRHYMHAWKDRVGDLLMLYASTGPISVHGSWGLREYAGQPLSQAPKEQAVRQFLDEMSR